LGNIADLGFLAPLAGGIEGNNTVIFLLTEDGFQKGALAGTVGANEGYQLTAVHVHIHILQDLLVANGDGKIADPQAAGIAAAAAVYGASHCNASFTVSML
jgi:hypothetical protein